MRRARAMLCLWALACACQPGGPEVPFRVVTLGDDPFFATTATAISVTAERDGVLDPTTRTLFAPDARVLTMPPLPFDTGYALVVETELSGLVLARGRSFPFDVDVHGASRVPDVSLGVLGRYGLAASGDASDPISLVVATDEGAALASATGVSRFVAHGADARPTTSARIAWPPSRAGARFAALGGAVLAVGGTQAGASLVGGDGAVLAELPASAVAAQRGVALVPIDEAHVLAIGGARDDGTLLSDVVRIAWDGTSLTATALDALPDARRDARAIALPANTSSGVATRVLVYDGTVAAGAADDVVLLDPDGHAAPSATVLTLPTRGAAACTLDTGLVLLAGGRDASGVSGALSILVVQPDAAPPAPTVSVLSPSPPPLFRAREQALALMLGSGLALIVGGVDDTAQPVAESEIAEVHFDSLPGTVVLTGSLPVAGPQSAAARLRDHTVLVASGGSVFVYFPPRGE